MENQGYSDEEQHNQESDGSSPASTLSQRNSPPELSDENESPEGQNSPVLLHVPLIGNIHNSASTSSSDQVSIISVPCILCHLLTDFGLALHLQQFQYFSTCVLSLSISINFPNVRILKFNAHQCFPPKKSFKDFRMSEGCCSLFHIQLRNVCRCILKYFVRQQIEYLSMRVSEKKKLKLPWSFLSRSQ